MRYTVTWSVVVGDAVNPRDAAEQAREIFISEPETTLFTVTDADGNSETVEI